jgi:hypothetical protein
MGPILGTKQTHWPKTELPRSNDRDSGFAPARWLLEWKTPRTLKCCETRQRTR